MSDWRAVDIRVYRFDVNDHLELRFHRSQFPAEVQAELVRCLCARRLNHKFLYESNRQAGLWLAIHNKFAPFTIGRNGEGVYARMSSRCAERLGGCPVNVISLGCGSGHKDAGLLRELKEYGCRLTYVACDVSPALVIEASQTVGASCEGVQTSRLVCDLLATGIEPAANSKSERLILAFGLIPNFEPSVFFARVKDWLSGGARFLMSANLSVDGSLDAIVPQYDNIETRAWLLAFVRDLGVDVDSDHIRFTVETDAEFGTLQRIEANLVLERDCDVSIGSETIRFEAGERMRLFFSYRYTLAQLNDAALAHGLTIIDSEVAADGEEGVFELARC